MRENTAGTSGLRVSELGLGVSTWGEATPAEDTGAILRTFVDAGGTLIDTSPAYADGVAEKLLGDLLRRRTVDRGQLVLSSSSGVDPTLPLGRRVDCSRRALMAQLDRSLAVLGTDHLDVWSVGFWDPRTPPEEVAETLDWAVRTGRSRYAGVRGYSGWQLAVTHAAGGIRTIVAAQAGYSLLDRRSEEELLPAAEHLGVGFFAAAPLAQGVLTGKYRQGIPTDSRGASPKHDAEVQGLLVPRSVTVVDALCTAAEGLDIPPAAAAVAWIRGRGAVTSAVMGVRTVAQLEEVLGGLAAGLPKAIRAALDEVSL
ncbi:aldo/keto reductase [Corynebacterium sp. P5848]|uniref:aldo/keto reductase n=1 Tax=Corynebacterium marambiense TaxID=2765364 RepID=UPI002260CF0C|nr:aldo/keto reductase [Corynebacterium marambiense]MCX7543477.1 aldo/keto reductase [Corynebacterium marambiense]